MHLTKWCMRQCPSTCITPSYDKRQGMYLSHIYFHELLPMFTEQLMLYIALNICPCPPCVPAQASTQYAGLKHCYKGISYIGGKWDTEEGVLSGRCSGYKEGHIENTAPRLLDYIYYTMSCSVSCSHAEGYIICYRPWVGSLQSIVASGSWRGAGRGAAHGPPLLLLEK